MKNIEKLIYKIKKSIRKENIEIDQLFKKIDEYETLIHVVNNSEINNYSKNYKEKINQCYLSIDTKLDNISTEKKILNVLKNTNQIFKRGEKCA